MRRLVLLLWILSGAGFPSAVFGFCHQIEVARSEFKPVATAERANDIAIEWFGHSTFQITSSKGTRILTDPHGRQDLPWPSLPQHIVTTSHPHGPHSSIWMAKGNPVILEGLTPAGENWSPIHMSVRDVSVYVVPAYHDKSQGLQRGKNAIFVFRVDDICIAHLGDLGHFLTPEQLKMMGQIDIALVPLAGGIFTVTAQEARKVTQQIQPKIAIPMHYVWMDSVEEYTQGHANVVRVQGRTFKISRKELPAPTTIVVLWSDQR